MSNLKEKEVDSKYCPDNTSVIETKDIKQAVLGFENILKEFKNMSKIDNYEGGIEEFKNDIISLFIKKHKKIFGDWEK